MRKNNNNEHQRKIARAITLAVYVAFAVLPLYWMLSMSLKTNEETLAGFSIWPRLQFAAAGPSEPMMSRRYSWPTGRSGSSKTISPVVASWVTLDRSVP